MKAHDEITRAEAMDNREESLREGRFNYHGRRCHCGNTIRGTGNGRCISCDDLEMKRLERKASKVPVPDHIELSNYKGYQMAVVLERHLGVRARIRSGLTLFAKLGSVPSSAEKIASLVSTDLNTNESDQVAYDDYAEAVDMATGRGGLFKMDLGSDPHTDTMAALYG